MKGQSYILFYNDIEEKKDIFKVIKEYNKNQIIKTIKELKTNTPYGIDDLKTGDEFINFYKCDIEKIYKIGIGKGCKNFILCENKKGSENTFNFLKEKKIKCMKYKKSFFKRIDYMEPILLNDLKT